MAKRHIRLPSLTGQIFGRVTVIGQAYGPFKISGRYWYCECSCGNSITLDSRALRSAKLASCGCRRRECLLLGGEHNRTHGLSKSSEYDIWCSMIARCKPRHKYHKYYADRGIEVCPEWKSFARFIADMGFRPSPNHSLDRIDNNKGYNPVNCRWATLIQQARNKTSTILLTRNGETLTVPEWAERLGIAAKTIRYRVSAGWSEPECLQPLLRHHRKRAKI